LLQTDKIIQYTKEHLDEYLAILGELVKRESYTHAEKAVKDICADYARSLFDSIGFETETIEHPIGGSHIRGKLGSGSKNILLLGHYDTVFPTGTIESRPFYVKDDRAYGPGVFDMKGGIMMLYAAVKALQQLDLMPDDLSLSLFLNADEEGGSVTAKEHIIEMAKKADACLSAEPGQSEYGIGYLCDRRYGRAVYTVKALGAMAHAGHNPKSNPALEIAKQAQHISERCRTEDGKLFASVVSLHAGAEEATAMTPGEAYLIVDIRFIDTEHQKLAVDFIQKLASFTEGVSLEITGGVEKPPLTQTAETDFVLRRACQIIEAMGHQPIPTISGGGSDTNFTGGAGCPTIDGLGVNGAFLHNPKEFTTVSTIPERVALLAELIRTLF